MRLNVALVDYLTLTTFDLGAALVDVQNVLTEPDVYRRERRLQYVGQAAEGLFVGFGRQSRNGNTKESAGTEHTMLQASGEIADRAFDLTLALDVRCTRIDVQVTIAAPPAYSARHVVDSLTAEHSDWTGRARKVTMVESGDRCDTVYIGSRSSDTLIRLYIKPDRYGEPSYLRFEVEYKGSKADGVRSAIIHDRHTRAGILAFELGRLPELPFDLHRLFRSVLGGFASAPPVTRVETQNSTLDWILTQVEPSILRLLHSHEHGDRMKEIIQRWSAHADR